MKKITLSDEEVKLVREMIGFADEPEIEGSYFDMINEAYGIKEGDRLYEMYQRIKSKLG